MKKVLILWILMWLSPAIGAQAQQIILGKKAPEVKPAAWLDNHQAKATPLIYIEFFHPSNKACMTSVGQLKKLADKLGTKLSIIIVTRDEVSKISPLLKPYLSANTAVALDGDAKIFGAFGVEYVPFGVLTDSKGRALWLGNSLQMNERIIEDNLK